MRIPGNLDTDGDGLVCIFIAFCWYASAIEANLQAEESH
jgi:hypothetical protein